MAETERAAGPAEDGAGDEGFLGDLYRGGELLAAGQLEEAREVLERAFAAHPRNAKARNLLGLVCFKQGVFDRAAQVYEMLVDDNPVDPTLRVNLGLVYLKTNLLERATREFEIAVELAPDHKKAQNYLGLAYAQGGDYARARACFVAAGSAAMVEKMDRALREVAAPSAEPAAEAPPPAAEGAPADLGSEALAGEGQGWEQGSEPAYADSPAPAVEAPPMADPAAGYVAPLTSEFGLTRAEATNQPFPAEAAGPVPDADAAALDGASEVPTAGEDVQIDADDRAFGETAPSPDWEAATPPESAPVPAEGEAAPVEEPAPGSQPIDGFFEANAPAPLRHDGAAAFGSGSPVRRDPEPAPIPEPAPAPAPVEEPAAAAEPAPDFEPKTEAFIVGAANEVYEPKTEAFAVGAGSAWAPRTEAIALGDGSSAAEASAAADPVHSTVWTADDGPAISTLEDLSRTLSSPLGSGSGSFEVLPETVILRVRGELFTRLEGLIAAFGSLQYAPEMKRFRGKTTDKAFGDGERRMLRVTGEGSAQIATRGRTFVPVELAGAPAYFLEDVVFGFQGSLSFENGRVPSRAADLHLVHFRGDGQVLLAVPMPLRAIEIRDLPCTLPMSVLVGWHGALTPRIVGLPEEREGAAAIPAVELTGEGYALVSASRAG